MEYSLTEPNGQRHEFRNLNELFLFIRKKGEIDGWILRVHHM